MTKFPKNNNSVYRFYYWVFLKEHEVQNKYAEWLGGA